MVPDQLVKMSNTLKARQVIAYARGLLGGNGILLENHVTRHITDVESIYAYEGTEHIQTVIVGRDITGVSAFAQLGWVPLAWGHGGAGRAATHARENHPGPARARGAPHA
jgi:Acyl-CoA dehydrogenase, C-terminal domain